MVKTFNILEQKQEEQIQEELQKQDDIRNNKNYSPAACGT